MSRTVPQVGGASHLETDTPSLCDCGEHPQVFFKRQVGRGRPAMGWGAVGPTCRLCYPVLGCPGLALVTWWQSGCLCTWMLISVTPCPVQAVALGLAAPACVHTGEGEGIGRSLRFGLLLLPPATTCHLHLPVTVEDGTGRTELRLHPKAGR